MNDFWKKHKIKVILLAYVTISFLAGRFVVLPLVSKIQEESNSIQERIIDNRINDSRLEKLPEMEADLKNCQDNGSALDVILNPNDEVGFIKQLESIAESTGNKITLSVADDSVAAIAKKTVKADDKKTIEGSLKYGNYVSMSINLKGNYPGLVSFIKKLENSDHYVNVLSIKSTKSVEEDQAGSGNTGNIFSPSTPLIGGQSVDQSSQKSGKEILNSVISIIIYTEK